MKRGKPLVIWLSHQYTVFKYSDKSIMKPDSRVLRSDRMLDQVREVIPYKHYSAHTEQAYVHWVRLFVRWHGRVGEMRQRVVLTADAASR